MHIKTCVLCTLALATSAVAAEDPHDPEHVHDASTVVVTGSPLELSSDELAITTHTLDREQILDHLRPTLGEMLAREPGVAASGFTSGASRPVIRGQDAFRVRVLENGLGTHDVSALSPDHGVPVNPLTTRRVEVVRGPSTLRYGGGAIGGVVNALTNRVPRARILAPFRGEVYSSYGAGAAERNGAVVLEGGQGPLAWHFDAMRQRSGDVEAPKGIPGQSLRNSDVDAYALSAGAALVGAPGRIGLAFARFANDYGIALEDASIDLDQNVWFFESDWNEPSPGIEVVRVRGNLARYEHDEVVPGEGAAATFENDQEEVRVEVVHGALGPLRGAVGVQYGRRDFRALGEASEFLLPTDTDTLALYIWEELPIGNVATLQVGARTEQTTSEGTPVDDFKRSRRFRPVSFSAGVVADVGDNASASVNLSAMQRAPDVVELFARGPHEATQTFEVGDAGLDEERSLSAEASIRGEFERFSGELSGFYTSYDDYVFGRVTGRTCDEMGACIVGPGNELMELVYSKDEATFYGGEAVGRAELFELGTGHVGVDGQIDFVRGRLDSGNVPRQPPLRYGGGLHFEGERVNARVGFLRHRKQRRNADFENETGGYTSVDTSLQVRVFDQGERTLDVIINGSNLLDERGRNHVNFRKDELPVAGRVVRFGLRGSF